MVQITVQCFNSLALYPVLKSHSTEISKTVAGQLSNFAHILNLTVVKSNYSRAKTTVDSNRITHSEKSAFLTLS